MSRSEALKKAQKLYRERNRERYNNNVREYNRVYNKNHYDEEAQKKKSAYYFKNRNYINKEFSKDLIKMFKE